MKSEEMSILLNTAHCMHDFDYWTHNDELWVVECQGDRKLLRLEDGHKKNSRDLFTFLHCAEIKAR